MPEKYAVAYLDDRNRAPSVEVLPDQRLRVERTYDVINVAAFLPNQFLSLVKIAWGTPDIKYTNCLLIKQDLLGQHPAGNGMRADPTISPEKHPPMLKRTWEQIDPSLETMVGNSDVTVEQSGIYSVTDEFIQFSTGTAIYGVPGVTVAPAPFANCILRTETRTDDGTLRQIKRVYISAGLVKQNDDVRNEGSLLLRTLVYYNQVPPTPSGFTLIKKDVDYPNGNPVYTYTFALGYGVIDIRTQAREGGLRLQSYVSFGTAFIPSLMQPAGVLMSNDSEAMDGFYRFTAVCMQNSAGGDPTIGTALAYGDKHPFRYPGRAKVFAKSFAAIYGSNTSGVGHFTATAWDVFLSPPVDVELDAIVSLTYGTATGLVLGTAFWNPDNWAVMRATYQRSQTITPVSQIKALNGYRAINAGTAYGFTAGSTIISFGAGTVDVSANVTSCLGDPIYQLSSGSLEVDGGPVAPDSLTWVLSAKMEPAFTALNGTQYFRTTQIAATVPAQTALLV